MAGTIRVATGGKGSDNAGQERRAPVNDNGIGLGKAGNTQAIDVRNDAVDTIAIIKGGSVKGIYDDAGKNIVSIPLVSGRGERVIALHGSEGKLLAGAGGVCTIGEVYRNGI